MTKEHEQPSQKKRTFDLSKIKIQDSGFVIENQYMAPRIQRFPLTEQGKVSHILTRRS